jgi:acyl-CoA hydrolase
VLRQGQGARIKVTDAEFTFVAVHEDGRPRELTSPRPELQPQPVRERRPYPPVKGRGRDDAGGTHATLGIPYRPATVGHSAARAPGGALGPPEHRLRPRARNPCKQACEPKSCSSSQHETQTPVRTRTLQHGICVGLIELELAERPKGTLTHHEVLSGRINIAEAALQRIGIEKCTATSRLKRNGRHALCHLGNADSIGLSTRWA